MSFAHWVSLAFHPSVHRAVRVSPIGAVIGTHGGPRVVGVAFHRARPRA